VSSNEEEILAELKEIRKLLTPAAAPAAAKGLVPEFRAFLSQYKVLGLAVAFILGVYLGALVKSLVTDLVLPVIGMAVPGANLTTLTVTVRGQIFGIGDFIDSVITFLLVALVIFLIVKAAKRYKIE
jgi:large conductance mechanosensitive channel